MLNDVGRRGLGFDSDRNAATFLTQQTSIELPEMSKRELAEPHPGRGARAAPAGFADRGDRGCVSSTLPLRESVMPLGYPELARVASAAREPCDFYRELRRLRFLPAGFLPSGVNLPRRQQSTSTCSTKTMVSAAITAAAIYSSSTTMRYQNRG